jgi:hypothetical protein
MSIPKEYSHREYFGHVSHHPAISTIGLVKSHIYNEVSKTLTLMISKKGSLHPIILLKGCHHCVLDCVDDSYQANHQGHVI